jgi:sulfur carrier protein
MAVPADADRAEIRVQVNGHAEELPAGTTLGQLVDRFAGRRAGVAVAVNRQVVPRSAWDATLVVPGDQVELLGAVAGG